jgi:hypothetical protein
VLGEEFVSGRHAQINKVIWISAVNRAVWHAKEWSNSVHRAFSQFVESHERGVGGRQNNRLRASIKRSS